MGTLLTADQVKEKLGIDDFRSIKKDQLIEFVSSIPDMDKETAIACIEQFPEFRSFSIDIIKQLGENCNAALESAEGSRKDAVISYQRILDECDLLLAKPDLSIEECHHIIDREVEIADRIAEINSQQQSFIERILKTIAGVATGALLIGGTILGVKISKKQ